MKSTTVGIDLGTTNSLIGAIREGSVMLFAGSDGRVLMPSVVGVSAEGEVLVGRAARNRRMLDPEGTSRSVKRLMGSDSKVRVGTRTLSPPEVSALLLAAMLDRAQESLGERPERAVITVPAYFTDQQRQATRDAAEIAGLEVERLVNEPTAASLTYSTGEEERVLVYDLGGGTFDVSILERDEGFMEVHSSHGDTHLGGDDIDVALVEMVLDRLGDAAARVRADVHAMTRLAETVERAKIELSTSTQERLLEPFLTGTGAQAFNLDLVLTRADVEEVAAPLLAKTLACVDRALADAKLRPKELDRVLLVGGTSQMPLVAETLRQHLDMPAQLMEQPDLAVARGAALLAGRASGAEVDEIIVDIAPLSLAACGLGDESHELESVKLIPRGTVIPTERRDSFFTMYEDQDIVRIPITQGDSRWAEDNTPLGEVMIEGLPPSPAGSPVDLVYRLDLSGVLHVSASHRASGKKASARILHGPSRLSAQERRKAKANLAVLRDEGATPEPQNDEAMASAVRLARSMLARAKRTLESNAEGVLDPDARTKLEQTTQTLDAALSAGEDVEALTDQLADVLYDLS